MTPIAPLIEKKKKAISFRTCALFIIMYLSCFIIYIFKVSLHCQSQSTWHHFQILPLNPLGRHWILFDSSLGIRLEYISLSCN